MRGLLVAALATAAVAFVAGAPGLASTAAPVAVYEMNEPAGSTVLTDTGPYGLNGVIGAEAHGGFSYLDGAGYDFEWLTPNTAPTHPEHLITVPDNPQLNPGDRDFAVTLRLRTTNKFGNIIQKGQAGTAGGRWKIEAPGGYIVCAFQGSYGYVEARSTISVEDGQWHVVRCERDPKYVTVTIDGAVNVAVKRRTGTISNTWPMSIGGKTQCDQIKVTCDYFPGDIDWVRIDASA